MAKQTKKNEAEKTVKKSPANKQEKIKEQIENNFDKEDTTETIEATEVGVDVNKIEEAINEIEPTIENDKVEKEIEEKINNSVEEINSIVKNINDLEESKKNLGEALKANPEDANKLIQKEIEKTVALKNEVNKKINSKKPVSVTGWWNGMGYDF